MNITVHQVDERAAAQKYDFDSINSSHAFKEAENRNMKVVLPAEDELLLDIDNEEDLRKFENNYDKFSLHIAEILSIDKQPSRSRETGHYHVYVKLATRVSAQERVLYQALLGSDRTRELLSLVRVFNDDPHPTLFIEPTEPLMLEAAPVDDECQVQYGADDVCGLPKESPIHTVSPMRHDFRSKAEANLLSDENIPF